MLFVFSVKMSSQQPFSGACVVGLGEVHQVQDLSDQLAKLYLRSVRDQIAKLYVIQVHVPHSMTMYVLVLDLPTFALR